MHDIKQLIGFLYRNKNANSQDTLLYTINGAGCNERDKSFFVQRNASYKNCVLHYVFNGYGYLEVGGKGYKLNAGDLFVLGPDEKHLYKADSLDGIGVLWAEFYGSNSTDIFHFFSTNNIRVINSDYNKQIYNNLYNLVMYLKINKLNKYEISKRIYHIMMSVLEASQMKATVVQQLPDYIHKALHYIEMHLEEKILVEDIAKTTGYSYAYFERSFKKHIGKPVAKYILTKKIDYAIALICYEKYTYEMVCEKLGFYDVSHFLKCFKRVTGKKVSEYTKITN